MLIKLRNKTLTIFIIVSSSSTRKVNALIPTIFFQYKRLLKILKIPFGMCMSFRKQNDEG
jgi:hypothetical protein